MTYSLPPVTPTPIIAYRPEIDGLRALAVTLVVLVHAFPSRLPNGFIGVDIFFVISGFLITDILIAQNKAGTFSLVDFYIRRASRIFPALSVVLIASIAFGWASMYASEFKGFGRSVAAGAGFVANINFFLEAGYWDISSKLKPLLHLWSLGVEEQFYLLWPILIWAAWSRSFINVATVCFVIFAASFAWNLHSIKTDQAATFYLPFARFWELLAGAGLAIVGKLLPPERTKALVSLNSLVNRLVSSNAQLAAPETLNNVCAFLGLGLISIALAVQYPQQEFPGKHAILPVLGTVLIISAGSQAWVNAKLLSHKWVVYVGLISFPLYLWHWPLLTFARILGDGHISASSRNLALLSAFVLSAATYHIVEKPIRSNPRRKGQKAIALAILLAACGITGYFINAYDGLEARYGIAKAPIAAHALPTITNTSKVVLLGDSHAGHFAPGLFTLYREKLSQVTSAGWPFLVGTGYRQDYVPHRTHTGTPELTADGIERIVSDRSIDIVIVANAYNMYFEEDSLRSYPSSAAGETSPSAYESGLRQTVKVLTDAGKKVIYVKTVPYVYNVASVAACSINALPILRRHPPDCLIPMIDIENRRKTYDEIVTRALAGLSGVAIFDTLKQLCDERYCYVEKDGVLMYKDPSHLSDSGSALLGIELAKLIETMRSQKQSKTLHL